MAKKVPSAYRSYRATNLTGGKIHRHHPATGAAREKHRVPAIPRQAGGMATRRRLEPLQEHTGVIQYCDKMLILPVGKSAQKQGAIRCRRSGSGAQQGGCKQRGRLLQELPAFNRHLSR